MTHDFSLVFETDNPYWQRVLDIFEKNEKFEKKVVSKRNLHHKFPRAFSKILGEPIDNDKDNLISLSLADHFLVHYYYYLLARKGFRQSMATAFTFMAKKGLKYMTPETAEEMAKDYAEAKAISDKHISEMMRGRKLTEEHKKHIKEHAARQFGEANGMYGKHHTKEMKTKLSKEMKEYYLTHPEYREAILPLGRKHSENTKKKMSDSARNAATPELRKLRSETRKGVSHPHKSGRKGLPLSEFGKLFYAHYGFTSVDHAVLYRKELRYWREHNKCSWEEMENINSRENEKT